MDTIVMRILWLAAVLLIACGGDDTTAAGTDGDGGGVEASGDNVGAPVNSADAAEVRECRRVGDSCESCRSEKCCKLLDRCADDADCTCMALCTGSSGLPGLDACAQGCGLSGSPASFHALEECMATTCPDSDECSRPADYTVPPPANASGASSEGIGAGELPDCAFDPELKHDPDGEVLQLESADGEVCVRIERRNEGPGELENIEWTLLDIRVGPLGEVVHVDDGSSICWWSSHHNFTDWAHVWTGERRYDVKVREDDHGGPYFYYLLSYQQGPLEAGVCAEFSDGVGPIGPVIELLPVNP